MSAIRNVDQIGSSVARERLLDAAYELFSRRGVQNVGVEEILARSGVAKATLYRHFRSKDDLVLAFLRRREDRWTLGWVEAESEQLGSSPEGKLLAIFDLFDAWFRTDEFEGCSFINVLLEMGPSHDLGKACIAHLENIRSVVIRRAEQAGLRDPAEFARAWHILMKGSIITAAEGDTEAAQRAKSMAAALIERHRSN